MEPDVSALELGALDVLVYVEELLTEVAVGKGADL